MQEPLYPATMFLGEPNSYERKLVFQARSMHVGEILNANLLDLIRSRTATVYLRAEGEFIGSLQFGGVNP